MTDTPATSASARIPPAMRASSPVSARDGAGAPATAARPLSLPARAADRAVWLYQQTLSPVLAAAFPSWGCRFHPTCSHYARGALHEHGFLAGGMLAARRLARCGPWHPGGTDPVPPRRTCLRAAPPPPPPLPTH